MLLAELCYLRYSVASWEGQLSRLNFRPSESFPRKSIDRKGNFHSQIQKTGLG